MPARKADAADIHGFIDGLGAQLRLDARRRTWTQYIYHFSDVRNIAQVLKRGALLSRDRCDAEGVAKVDSAQREIIGQSPWAHTYVRLYFRPRTPTQYRMQGIRPKKDLWKGAHCPVPVFLLFDSKALLSRADVQFTNGSMAARDFRQGQDARFLRNLPFELIYHDGPIRPDEDKRAIKFHRHAEVIVERELDLGDLREIVCRSGPERDTLLFLLDTDAKRWESMIRLERRGEGIFEALGTYVENVLLVEDQIMFVMPALRGPFELELQVWEFPTGKFLGRGHRTVEGIPSRTFMRLPRAPQRVHARFLVDEALAYEGIVSKQTLF